MFIACMDMQGPRQNFGQGNLSPLTPSITPPSRTSAGSTSLEHHSREYSSGSDHRQHRLSRKGTSEGSDISRVPSGKQLGRGPSQDVVDVEAASQLQDALNSISSKDWRERLEGLRCIEALTPRLGYVPEGLLVTLLDQVTHKLSDGNSKVIVNGLEVRSIKPNCRQVLNSDWKESLGLPHVRNISFGWLLCP